MQASQERVMTDKTSALIIEHLRVLRLEMGELRADVRDMRGRLTSLEASVADTCMATLPANPSKSTVLEGRLERVEHRLRLREA